MKLSTIETDVSDENVDKRLSEMRMQFANYGKVDRPAAEKDMVKVSYSVENFNDGDIPESAANLIATEETWLMLQDPETIPGIKDGLQGISAGETCRLNVLFPDDFHESFLANRSLTYVFNIHEVNARIMPELNDDFAKSVGVDTVDELRSVIKKKVSIERINEKEAALRNQVCDYLMTETADFPLPQKLLGYEKEEALLSTLTGMKYMNSASLKEMADKGKDELQEVIEKEAAKRLKLSYIIAEIAKVEGIIVDDKEVESVFHSVKDDYQQQAKKGNRNFNEDRLRSSIGSNLLTSKVLTTLIGYGVME